MNGQDKVLDHTREQLSALFDGELALDEARFLQRRLQHDAALAGCVSRWQSIGDALRGQAAAAAPAGFSERVSAAVAVEPAPAPSRRAPAPRRGWVPGAALAASVALVAFFATRQPVATPDGNGPAVQVAQASTPDALANPDALQAPARAPQPAPQAPDQQAAQLAAAVAVAEVPRRAAARRNSASRGQAQRAAATRAARASVAEAQPQLAVAAATPLPASALPAAVSPDNPFAPAGAASQPAVVARPWPRALLPSAGTFNVGYGTLQPVATQGGSDAFHPFRPRVAAGQAAPQEIPPQVNQETAP